MAIPELTQEQRVESFISDRIPSTMMCGGEDTIVFTKKELAEFCLKEIDYAVELVKNTDFKDVEEQFEGAED